MRQPTVLCKDSCFCKKTDEEFESLCHFCNIQKKGTGENPDTFSGAEGETRRVFTRRVRFANSLFYVPFCSAKRRTKSSSLSKQIHIYKKKKHKGKILVLFLAQKERLDGFPTRRVRFANSLFYVPFCSAKRRTKSSSLSKQIHIYKKKKHKGKILVLFLAQKERLELSRRLPDLRP